MSGRVTDGKLSPHTGSNKTNLDQNILKNVSEKEANKLLHPEKVGLISDE